MKTANILIVGLGPHARRIYVPALMEYASIHPIRLAAAVDLKTQQSTIDSYLREKGIDLKIAYIDPFDTLQDIPSKTRKILDALVDTLDIQGVIISTEPTAHKKYAEWAIKKGLHILMDKPISTRKRASIDEVQARGILEDYNQLLELYNASQSDKQTIFSINVQRRYDHGFGKVKELIEETTKRFNVPITSMQVMHADGSWRFPKEILTQESHGLSDGFGKVSHSGYHLFDMAWQLYNASQVDIKRPDELEIFSSAFNPNGLNECINEQDYIRYFGNEFEKTGLTKEEYAHTIANFGEMDSFNVIRLMKNDINICNISVNLLHSSFSRRSWAIPNADFYKSNGRVKHQQFIIQQGPFQCIQIHNYQSNHEHDVDNTNEFEIRGNNHFDIYIFRNVGMSGYGEAFTKITSRDLEEQTDRSGLTIENAKYRVILEFIDFILGRISLKEVKSNIDTHIVPVKIMSGIYQSSAKMHKKNNPLVRLSI